MLAWRVPLKGGVVGCVVWLAGCAVSDDAKLRILGNVRPNASCEYSTDATSPEEQYPAGYVDLAFGRSYFAHLLVQNDGTDPVRVNDGWRNLWYEPDHDRLIYGTGEAARSGLVRDGATIEGKGGRGIVKVDLLGDALRVLKGHYEEQIQSGRNPATLVRELLAAITLEGDADGTKIESDVWEYGLTVTLGPLVEFPSGTDSPSVPDRDCCAEGVPVDSCTPGQDYQGGSCFTCVTCWPEVCNFSKPPTCGGTAPPACVWTQP